MLLPSKWAPHWAWLCLLSLCFPIPPLIALCSFAWVACQLLLWLALSWTSLLLAFKRLGFHPQVLTGQQPIQFIELPTLWWSPFEIQSTCCSRLDEAQETLLSTKELHFPLLTSWLSDTLHWCLHTLTWCLPAETPQLPALIFYLPTQLFMYSELMYVTWQ